MDDFDWRGKVVKVTKMKPKASDEEARKRQEKRLIRRQVANRSGSAPGSAP